MHETSAQAADLARAVLAALPPLDARSRTDVVLAPPFTALPAVAALTAQSGVALGAQNMHWGESGAYTGEIAAPMLLELGVRYVILGHSERRRYFHETDEEVNRKVRAALSHGLTPIIAVGETAEERDAGATDARVVAQTSAALDGIAPAEFARLALAYEPVWAIGTGRNCDPTEADRVMACIRATLPGLERTRLLYGGSVTPANFASYLAGENCDGGLIGGASLDAEAFAQLAALALDAA